MPGSSSTAWSPSDSSDESTSSGPEDSSSSGSRANRQSPSPERPATPEQRVQEPASSRQRGKARNQRGGTGLSTPAQKSNSSPGAQFKDVAASPLRSSKADGSGGGGSSSRDRLRRSTGKKVVLGELDDSSGPGGSPLQDKTASVMQPEETTPKPRMTARRSGGRARRSLQSPVSALRPGITLEQPSPPAPHQSRPSGPLLLSGPGSASRGATSRASFQKFRSAPMLDASDLPFTAPSPFNYFPTFKGCARYDGFGRQHETLQFFDCKFYPYTEPGVDPVFAIVGGSEVIVARPSKSDKEPLDVLMWNHEEPASPAAQSGARLKRSGKRSAPRSDADSIPKETESVELNSCAWLRDPRSLKPLLAVAGSKPSAIKIIDVLKQSLAQTLVGHGKEVNDLAVSPQDPSILASASGDHTVRVWSIDAKYAKQPCLLMCAGEGHKQGLLTVAFHSTAKYLLTGGVDCAVCLWALPKIPDERSGTDKPTVVHYPHFKTTAIHCSFVDCVAFHHDLILSKSAIENKIVLWRIEGFDSRDDPPSSAPTSTSGPTRSAFGGKYQRLIQFGVPEAISFYIRFSLFNFPGQRPLLAIGNEKSRVLFWDLQALDEYYHMYEAAESTGTGDVYSPTRRGGGRVRRRGGRWRAKGERHPSAQSDTSNTRSDGTNAFGGGGSGNSAAGSTADLLGVRGMGKQKLAEKYRMNDPFQTLEAHKTSVVQKVNFACRQVAWSVGGEYLVVVGDEGMIALFGRDMTWDR